MSISGSSDSILCFQHSLHYFCIPVVLRVFKGGTITPTGHLSVVRVEDMEGNSAFFKFSCLQCRNQIGDGD